MKSNSHTSIARAILACVFVLVLVACGGAPALVHPPSSESAVDAKFALLSNPQTSGSYLGKRVHTYAVYGGSVQLIQDARFEKGFAYVIMSPSDMKKGKVVCGLPVGTISTYVPTSLASDVIAAKLGTVYEITGVMHGNEMVASGSGGSLEVESISEVGFCDPKGGES